jgi:hypothetical protein
LIDLNNEVSDLIDAWCQRRALRPLRYVLPHWPHNGLTDGIAELKIALENVRAFGRGELLSDEERIVSRLIAELDHAVANRK